MAPSAAALAARRRVLAASARRHPRRVPRPDAPTAAAAGYALALAALLRPLDDALRAALADEGLSELTSASAGRADAQGEAPSAPTATASPAAVKRVQRAVARAARDLAGGRALSAAMERAAKAADAHSRAQWNAQAEALGLDVAGDDLFLAARLKAFRGENLALIRSLCAEHVRRVGKVLRENAGARVETIARELQEATGASKARAQLIARDQVLKINGQLTRDRHEAAGIVEYTWSASRDVRVREDHRALDGQRFRYDNPPIADRRTGRRGHPGMLWQCRCCAIPVLPE